VIGSLGIFIKNPADPMHIQKWNFILPYLVCTLCTITCLSQTASTLQLVPGTKNIYTDGTTQGKFHKFEHVFLAEWDQAETFYKFNRNRKTQRWVNYISSAIVVGGLIDGLRDADQGNDVFFNRLGTQVRNAILVGGIGNLFTGINKKRAKENLLSSEIYYSTLEDPDYIIVDTLISNKLTQVSTNKFMVNGQTTRLHKLDYLFRNNLTLKESFDLFEHYRAKQVKTNTTAITIGAVGIAGGIVAAGSSGDRYAALFGALVFGTGIGAGGLIAIINSADNGSQKKLHRSRLLSQIDPSMVFSPPIKPSLNLALTQNGVGMVYQF
jgi:hypothetical protein